MLHALDTPRHHCLPVRHELHVRAVVTANVLQAVGELLSRGVELLDVAEATGHGLAARVDDPRFRKDQMDQTQMPEVVRHLVDEERLADAVDARVR